MVYTEDRERHTFELYTGKPAHKLIASIIKDLKKHRKYTRGIRDGLQLFYSLELNQVGVLNALYPEIVERIASRPVQVVSTEIKQPDTTAIEAQQKQLDREWQRLAEREADLDRRERELELEKREMKLARDEKLTDILDAIKSMQAEPSTKRPFGFGANKAQTDESGSEELPAAQHGNAKVIQAPTFSAPVFDDDEDDDEPLFEVKADETAGQRATQNFLNSLQALIGD